MTEWLKKWLPSILFNIGEFIIIIAAGIGLNISFEHILMILLAFTLVRQYAGQPLHYRDWRLCLVWTTAVFMSLYFVARANVILSIFVSALCALVVSQRFNFEDTFMFKPKGESNYKILIDYIKYNGLTDEFLNAETLLKQRVSPQEYLIFKRILVEGKDWDSTERELDVHRQKIANALDRCYHYVIGRLSL